MPFQTLYHRRQAIPDTLGLGWYVNDAKELSWVDGFNIKKSTTLEKSQLRGLIVKHAPGLMPFSLSANYTVILARDLNKDQIRFVSIKEIMHCYFGPEGGGVYATNSLITFENHFNEFFGNSASIKSHQVYAEKRALWMALAVLCPEQKRRDYLKAMKANETSFDQVAADLRVPVGTARTLLSDRYEREVAEILE